MKSKELVVGIDISKARLDVGVVPSSEKWSVANDPDGLADPACRLFDLSPTLVVMEATGGLERSVPKFCGCGMVNPDDDSQAKKSNRFASGQPKSR